MKLSVRIIYANCFIFLLSVSVFAQRDKSVLLPESEAKNLARQCSRKPPPKFKKTWQPTGADLKAMESKFSKIKGLATTSGGGVEDPEDFYMQYIGIIVKGKRFIYVNAFGGYPEPPKGWKDHAYVICDGGTDWGVLYNVETGEFSDLDINGIA